MCLGYGVLIFAVSNRCPPLKNKSWKRISTSMLNCARFAYTCLDISINFVSWFVYGIERFSSVFASPCASRAVSPIF